MERSLAEYPSEILDSIVSHLHGFVVLRVLHQTGSKLLWRKLQQGVSHLEVGPDWSAKSDLQKISTFERLLSLEVVWHGMAYSECVFLWDILPVSVTNLRLTGGAHEFEEEYKKTGKESCNELGDASSDMSLNLSERLPNLRHLSLHGFGWMHRCRTETKFLPKIMTAFLGMLPRGLRSLHIQTMSQCASPYLSCLPPHLTKLTRSLTCEISDLPPLEPLPETLQTSLLEYSLQIHNRHAIPEFPPNLTSLTVSGQWDRLFSSAAPVLPSGLTSLIIEREILWMSCVCDNASLTYLPRTLKTLHFGNRRSGLTDAAQWPPSLTDLKIHVEENFTHTKNLPKTIKSLWISRHNREEPFDFKSLPQSLDTLYVCAPITSNGEMQQIPKCITTLSVLLNCPVGSITFWPSSLTSLTVWFMTEETYWTLETARSLPNTLTRLESTRMSDYIAQALPSSLTLFKVEEIEITGRVSMDYDSNLPSDTVIIPNQFYFDPLRLRSTSIGYPSSDPSFDVSTQRQIFSSKQCMLIHAHLHNSLVSINTVLRLSNFPPHITSLEFDNPLEESIQDLTSWVSLFVNLKSLVANFSYVAMGPCDLTSLTKLERLICVQSIPTDLEQHFPPNLTELGIRRSHNVWEGPLPTTLRKLSHPGSLSVVEPLKQLQSLELGEYDAPKFFPEDDDSLLLFDALPCLTELNACLELTQTQLEALVASGRKIELIGTTSLLLYDIDSNSEEIWGIKRPNSTSPFEEFIHHAVMTYYPHLPTLQPNQIRIIPRLGSI